MCSISANLRLTRRSYAGHSAFPRKEPRAESFTRFMVRVIRVPTTAEPRGFNSFHSMLLYSYSCRPLEKGRGKAAGWMRHGRWASILSTQFSILLLSPLLRRSCLSEADPSPALRAAPFSKGARAYCCSQYVR